MIAIGILHTASSKESLLSTLASAAGQANVELFVIADEAYRLLAPACMRFIPLGTSCSSAIGKMLHLSLADKVLFIDSQLKPSGSELGQILSAAEGASEALAKAEAWPALAFCMSKSALRQHGLSERRYSETLTDWFAMSCANLLIAGETIAALDLCLSRDTLDTLGKLPARAAAQVLKHLMTSSNIEDLFPDHDWRNRGKQSAASAYHSLAALFLKWSDIASATECLQISDTLDDSPRSLALKGMISKLRGETLGAVAHMVSSLQQYELRKQDSSEAAMQPKNMEMVDQKLRAGLAALNRRNNEAALECFTEAIFSFDPFFDGLAQVK
jgi:hypothetical protein